MERDSSYRLTRKFHVMAQFSRFIRPGCQIVQTDDADSLAAFDASRRQLVIVFVNDHLSARAVTYQLRGLATKAGEVAVYRTSPQEDVLPQPPIAMASGGFSAKLPARSVTTFVISDATPVP
jgi:O-glycosyl hydrolase